MKKMIAQSPINVCGTVYDDTGETLIGAVAQVKGTSIPQNATLTFSYVGYKTIVQPYKKKR